MTQALAYPAKITEEDGGFSIVFRDLPNIFSEGDTVDEAVFNAREVLDILLIDMVQDELDFPLPSAARKNEILIAASPEVTVPVLLLKLRKARHYTLADVANSMGVSYQNYQQIEAGKNITLKSLKKAAAALGATVEIQLHSIASQ